MLLTNLKHIESASEYEKFIKENSNVMICCGRMGPMCTPVYNIMEILEKEYLHVKFADMDFDNPHSGIIRYAPECKYFMGLPFTLYYKNGKIVKATGSIQTKEQITAILDTEFPS
jgi:thioredoxin 1